MENNKITEYKHIKCADDSRVVNATLQMYGMFFWELVGTQTVVSKESHLEEGFIDTLTNTISSVTTTERFTTINLKRTLEKSKLDQIKPIENEYVETAQRLIQIGSFPDDNYAPPRKQELRLMDFLALDFRPPWTQWRDFKKYGLVGFMFPVVARINKEYEQSLSEYHILKPKLDQIVKNNKQILNI